METDTCNICGKPLSEHRDGLACCHACGSDQHMSVPKSAIDPRVYCHQCGLDQLKSRWNRRATTAAERELAAAKALLAECQMLLRELADETECQCIPAYRERGLHGPNERCHMHTPICELLAKLEAAK